MLHQILEKIAEWEISYYSQARFTKKSMFEASGLFLVRGLKSEDRIIAKDTFSLFEKSADEKTTIL
jgi:hypothetical protein